MAQHNKPFNRMNFPNQPSGRGGARHESDAREPTLDEVWRDYLKNGYFDESGNLRGEFTSREFLEKLVREMSRARPPLTNHQLRRFFQHCRAIESRLKTKKNNWRSVEANFRFVDAAAADAFGKSSRKIPAIFHEFIKRNVAAVRDEKDFLKGFLPHFEALVGFGALHLKDKERN